MADGIEVPGGTHDEALDRFAETWWEDGSAAEAARTPTEPASAVVIRAERV